MHIRATFYFNLSRNIVALQVGKCFCSYYHRVASCGNMLHKITMLRDKLNENVARITRP